MQLKKITRNDKHLSHLLDQATFFQEIDRKVKQLLPNNLTPYLRIVCIREGILIIHVSNSMVATRLKMLLPALLPKIQQLSEYITHYHVKVKPENLPITQQKNFVIPPAALSSFHKTAKQLHHHPILQNAIYNLIKHHEQSHD